MNPSRSIHENLSREGRCIQRQLGYAEYHARCHMKIHFSQIFIDNRNRRLKVKPETLANTEDGTLGLKEEEYSENSTNVQPSIEER